MNALNIFTYRYFDWYYNYYFIDITYIVVKYDKIINLNNLFFKCIKIYDIKLHKNHQILILIVNF